VAEPSIPDPALYGEGQAREFNRYTLTGQWDLFFFSLLRERLLQDGLNPEVDLEVQFRGHLCRGVVLLYQRLKTLSDLSDMVSKAQQRAAAYNQGEAATTEEAHA
jgi:DNA sulfur modification protein DndE